MWCTSTHENVSLVFKSLSVIVICGRSVGIVRSRTKGHGVFFFFCDRYVSWHSFTYGRRNGKGYVHYDSMNCGNYPHIFQWRILKVLGMLFVVRQMTIVDARTKCDDANQITGI
jgi:hypothetical protein